MRLELYPIFTFFPQDSHNLENFSHDKWTKKQAKEYLEWFKRYSEDRIREFKQFIAENNVDTSESIYLIRFMINLLRKESILKRIREDRETVLSPIGISICIDMYLYIFDKYRQEFFNRIEIGMYDRKKTDYCYNTPCIFIDGEATEFTFFYRSTGLGLEIIVDSLLGEDEQEEYWVDDIESIRNKIFSI